MNTLKQLVSNFIFDERGVESTEVGVTTVVLAGGSANQLSNLKDTIQTKVTNVVDTVGAVDVS